MATFTWEADTVAVSTTIGELVDAFERLAPSDCVERLNMIPFAWAQYKTNDLVVSLGGPANIIQKLNA